MNEKFHNAVFIKPISCDQILEINHLSVLINGFKKQKPANKFEI